MNQLKLQQSIVTVINANPGIGAQHLVLRLMSIFHPTQIADDTYLEYIKAAIINGDVKEFKFNIAGVLRTYYFPRGTVLLSESE